MERCALVIDQCADSSTTYVQLDPIITFCKLCAVHRPDVRSFPEVGQQKYSTINPLRGPFKGVEAAGLRRINDALVPAKKEQA